MPFLHKTRLTNILPTSHVVIRYSKSSINICKALFLHCICQKSLVFCNEIASLHKKMLQVF